jgi:hypothetical protein
MFYIPPKQIKFEVLQQYKKKFFIANWLLETYLEVDYGAE